jgi:glycosyltransferase involved in cell wall biosynthesis
MHRSGTSALTRILNLLGAALPKHLIGANPSNATGHWEPERLVVLHDRMLAEAGSRWDDWRAFDPTSLGAARLSHYRAEIASIITQEYGNAALFVIKDPRICRFVGLYEEALGARDIAPLYVLPIRNPIAVLDSLASRDGITAPFAALSWLRHVLEAEEKTRGKLRAIVSYERLIGDWQAVARDISANLERDWQLPARAVAREAEAFLSRELVHHSRSIDELAGHPDIAAWIKKTYASLLALETGLDQSVHQAILDDIRTAFDAAAPIFGQAISLLKAREDKHIEQNIKLNQELIKRDASSSRIEIKTVRQALAAREAQLANASQALVEHEKQIANLDQNIVDRDKEIAALREVHNQYARQITALRASGFEKDALLIARERVIHKIHASTLWRMSATLRNTTRLWARLYFSSLGFPVALARCGFARHSRAPLHHWRAITTISRSGLFDEEWYLKKYTDVGASAVDPIRHYVAYGASEGRDPSRFFSTKTYLLHNPDVAASGLNPLLHFIRHGLAEGRAGGQAPHAATPPLRENLLTSTATKLRAIDGLNRLLKPNGRDESSAQYTSRDDIEADCKVLRDSGLFDNNSYRAAARIAPEADAIEHYLIEGWRSGLEPNPGFEGASLHPYYSSVGYAGPPAITHLRLRAAGAPAYATLKDAEAWAAAVRGSELFDTARYAASHDQIYDLDPALHYVIVGEQMGSSPSDAFDPKYYYDRNPDIARSAISALGHYILLGKHEGRRPISIAQKLTLDCSRLDHGRKTILIVNHEASRTGAPILAWNIAMRLREKYNVVALFIGGGELVDSFEECCAAIVGPVGYADLNTIDNEYIVKRILANYPITYAIANTIVSRLFTPALANAYVPVVSLIHEFASYTRPKEAMREGLDWSTQLVFSSDMTANSAKSEHPHLANRTIHVLPQGRCAVPRATTEAQPDTLEGLHKVFRPDGWENALVVLGAGFVHIRKGIDLFLACAATVSTQNLKRPVRFIWIGSGYDPVNDPGYPAYLSEQIARSGLEGKVAIIDAVDDLEPVYAMADVFFLSSRLDPLPNVTIDAAFHGLPVVCFENASGMAALLAGDPSLQHCVVPHLDVNAATKAIVRFANDEDARRACGGAMRRFAEATFDIDRYTARLDELGCAAIDIMRERARDFITLRDDPLFDESLFRQPWSMAGSREDAIRQFLVFWVAAGCAEAGYRRPCANFHPKIYAHENAARYDSVVINPLAHFIRSGKPDGPWIHDVIDPTRARHSPSNLTNLRIGIHAHFYYPELVTDFLSRIACNRSPCDLLLTTGDNAKASSLRDATAQYERGKVHILVVPNRGRDIGPFLTALSWQAIQRYDIIGHVHGKRSTAVDTAMGEMWREFLWQNLLGETHPMMDIVMDHFANDEKLGLVFPSDPHLCGWDANRGIAEGLAKRAGITETLPPFFDFPVGTMFWARVGALKPLFDLRLRWDDYPEEPIPLDGTVMHALERLLPFAARHVGYGYATTHIPGVTR